MRDLLLTIAGLLVDPVILAGGILAGWLFHADMKKPAWGLLLFVLPALPTVWRVPENGMFLRGVAQLLAAGALAAAAYWCLETLRARPRRASIDS